MFQHYSKTLKTKAIGTYAEVKLQRTILPATVKTLGPDFQKILGKILSLA